MMLDKQQIRHLRSLGHALKPVTMVGQQGLRESVIDEINVALDFHELIKVKVSVGDRKERDAVVASIVKQTGAQLVQRIGNIALLFRRNPKKPKVVIPG